MAKSRAKETPQLRREHRFIGLSDGNDIRYQCQQCGLQTTSLALLPSLPCSSGSMEWQIPTLLCRSKTKRNFRRHIERNRARGVAAARARKSLASGRKIRRDL